MGGRKESVESVTHPAISLRIRMAKRYHVAVPRATHLSNCSSLPRFLLAKRESTQSSSLLTALSDSVAIGGGVGLC